MKAREKSAKIVIQQPLGFNYSIQVISAFLFLPLSFSLFFSIFTETQ